jgi:ABC-type antimicrobial peptide transport system permease subunit
VLKVDGRPESVVSAVRAEVAELDPSLALARVQPMEEIVRGAIASDRFVASLLGLFATVATALAVVGLYGVVSYNVGSRMREMGVRMALGAGAGSISGMVLRRSLGLVALGVVMGVGAALAGGALLRELLFGVAPLDPVTLVGVPLILGAAAAVAAAIPALRAARVDPSVALRSE